MTQQTRTRLTLLALMGLTAVRIPLAILLRTVLPDATVSPDVNYAAAILQSLLMFALPGWLLMPVWQKPEGEDAPALLRWLLPLLAGVLVRAVATPLNGWWTALLDAPVQALPAAEGVWGTLLMLLAVAVIPAIAEEVFFRGALLTNLLRSGSRMQALLLTTLLFALMHGSLAGLPGHLLISLLLTLLMMHSGRLAVPVSVHMGFNLLALVWPDVNAIVPWIAGVLLVALCAWLIATLPGGKRRGLPVPETLLCVLILLAMALQYRF